MAEPQGPPRPKRIVLHIGTHKTGSTSLQRFLHEQVDLLHSIDAVYPEGFALPESHSELALLSARPERMWPARLRLPELRDEGWLRAARRHVDAQLQQLGAGATLVLSHEDLSYLRFDDELARLRELLGRAPVQVVVYLRDEAGFLSSYAEQLRTAGFDTSDDPSSFAHVEPGSWLTDREALLTAYRDAFGETAVTVLDYDDVVRRDRSIIPSFLHVLGAVGVELSGVDRYFLNRTGENVRPSAEQIAALRRRLRRQARS